MDALEATLLTSDAVAIPTFAPSLKVMSGLASLALRYLGENLDFRIVDIDPLLPLELDKNAPGSLMYPFVKNALIALLILLHLRFLVILGGGNDLMLILAKSRTSCLVVRQSCIQCPTYVFS